MFIPPRKIFFLKIRFVFSPIDLLASSIIMSVKCSTILSQFYPDYHKVWSQLDCCLDYIRLIPCRAPSWGSGGSNEFLVGEGDNGWSIGFGLVVTAVSNCYSNSDTRLEFVMERSIVKKVPLAMLCLVGLLLLRRKFFNRFSTVIGLGASPCYISAVEVA